MSGTLPEAAMRRIGLPWSPALVRRTLIGVGSAVLAARLALQLGVAIMCNGGTHHAHPGHGSGWCIFNDLAIAARAAQRDAGVSRVLLLDLVCLRQSPFVVCSSQAVCSPPHTFAHILTGNVDPSKLPATLPAGCTPW